MSDAQKLIAAIQHDINLATLPSSTAPWLDQTGTQKTAPSAILGWRLRCVGWGDAFSWHAGAYFLGQLSRQHWRHCVAYLRELPCGGTSKHKVVGEW